VTAGHSNFHRNHRSHTYVVPVSQQSQHYFLVSVLCLFVLLYFFHARPLLSQNHTSVKMLSDNDTESTRRHSSSFKACLEYTTVTLPKEFRKQNPPPTTQDYLVSFGLYAGYPFVLWALLQYAQTLCGTPRFLSKYEAITACQNLYLPFCWIMRSYKLAIIVLGSVADVAKSDEDAGQDNDGNDHSPNNKSKLKCRTWLHLSQELMSIGIVAFFLVFCLPVLAFWFMFLSIVVTSLKSYSLVKKMWKTAQDLHYNYVPGEDDAEDEEMQDLMLSSHNDDSENPSS
jgi:hypothetical protein